MAVAQMGKLAKRNSVADYNYSEHDFLVGNKQSDLISAEGYIFRGRLIQDFNLVHHSTKHLEKKIFVKDFIDDPGLMDKIMRTSPNSSIHFSSADLATTRKVMIENAYTRVHMHQRYINRLVNKNFTLTPLPIWIHWLYNTTAFNVVFYIAIALNLVIVGLKVENIKVIEDNTSLIALIEVIDIASCQILLVELFMRRVVQGRHIFWSSYVNVIDVIITGVTIPPSLFVLLFLPQRSPAMQKVLYIIRSATVLKIITRVRALRVLMYCLTKAARSLIFVVILLILLGIIMAVMGVTFFEDYVQSSHKSSRVYDSFKSSDAAVFLLFRLFTLDQWRNILREMVEVIPEAAAMFYVLVWIIAASFIIGNLFIAVLVNNFIQIREEIKIEHKRDEVEAVRTEGEKLMKITPSQQKLLASKSGSLKRSVQLGSEYLTDSARIKVNRTYQEKVSGTAVNIPNKSDTVFYPSEESNDYIQLPDDIRRANSQYDWENLQSDIPSVRESAPALSDREEAQQKKWEQAQRKWMVGVEQLKSKHESPAASKSMMGEKSRELIEIQSNKLQTPVVQEKTGFLPPLITETRDKRGSELVIPKSDVVMESGIRTPQGSFIKLGTARNSRSRLSSSQRCHAPTDHTDVSVHDMVRVRIRRFSHLKLPTENPSSKSRRSGKDPEYFINPDPSIPNIKRAHIPKREFQAPASSAVELFEIERQNEKHELPQMPVIIDPYIWHKAMKQLKMIGNSQTTTWSRPTYFNYLILMEHLQENLKERQHLFDLLTRSLSSMFDEDDRRRKHQRKPENRNRKSSRVSESGAALRPLINVSSGSFIDGPGGAGTRQSHLSAQILNKRGKIGVDKQDQQEKEDRTMLDRKLEILAKAKSRFVQK